VIHPAAATPAAPQSAPPSAASGPSQPPVGAGPGGYYLDDGPGDLPPQALLAVPDAQPAAEPLHRFANRPYVVFGREYLPMTHVTAHRERGMASWYGRRFHGRPTSSGEPYDMYGMTAAHPTLPIPSYVRVTNVHNGRSVVVRINDRGPFLHDRVIDLSYTAALKLDYVRAGSTLVDIELVGPQDAEPDAGPVAVRSPGAGSAPARSATDASARAGNYLQLAAFSTRERADAAIARFRREFRWLNVPIAIISESGLFKVQAGPWSNREQAMQAADRIADVLATRPISVTR
jgi:rare lipoprotein A